eukprot:4855920-Alexandrium_andersonii.AAC.1
MRKAPAQLRGIYTLSGLARTWVRPLLLELTARTSRTDMSTQRPTGCNGRVGNLATFYAPDSFYRP